ncbi:hypothetical protein Clacol_010398 [Clathrus columnatus]|uniref:Enoyl reductase (ER) domain-containing protein n=1 Tax=Clathrus columnatus TaxID=1419009 RepID=A0AAV5ASY6_9AGAM|nr:hypothetical protein Clacol_010398 [Clathrus columnatus]
MSIPSTMRAVIVQKNKTIAVQDVSMPTIKDNEVPIKVHAIAQNPTDWKEPGSISGVDYAGVVVKVGTSVTHLKAGDQVSSFTFGGTYRDVGAFAEYAKADADLVWLVPSGTITLEEASTMNCAYLYMLEVGLSSEHFPASVGQFAIQLAHLSGYKVITVASPTNHPLVKGLGADVVLDLATIRAMGIGPGKIIVLQTSQPNAIQERLDVNTQHTLIYTVFGNDIKWPNSFWPASSADRAHMVSYIPKITEFLRHELKIFKIREIEAG